MSNEVIQQFYAQFPARGKPLGRQINEWQGNSTATNNIVQSAFVNANPSNRSRDALAFISSGLVGSRHRYRIGYDKDRSLYVVQRNLGSDDSQSWFDVLTLNSSNQLDIAGGLNASLFYQILTVTETSGVPSFDTNKLIFNDADFYLTNNSLGQPIVNFIGGGGSSETASNIGAGTGLFAQKVANDLQFKSLIQGTNLRITSDADEVTIDALDQRFYLTVRESDGSPAYREISQITFDRDDFYLSQNSPNTDNVIVSSRGDKTTASNLGSGAGLFAQKVVNDLQFKSVVAGAGIKTTVGASSVTVESIVEGFYGITVKESDGSPAYKNINTVVFDQNDFYIGQNNPNTDEVVVSLRGAAAAVTASNLGSGTGLFAQKVANDLQFKSLVAGAGVKLSNNATTATIESTVEGFYGILFKESESGGYKHRDDTLVVDSTYFYLTSDNKSKPFLSFVPIIREVLTGNRIYYVRTDGSDSNNGLTNSSGGAFLTLQKAIDVVGTIDLAIYDVTIQLGNTGTYAGCSISAPFVGGPGSSVTIVGSTSAPSSYVINSTVLADNGAVIYLQGLDFTPASGNAVEAANLSTVYINGACVFGTATGAHMQSGNYSIISVTANYTIDGGAPFHLGANQIGAIKAASLTVTLTGTPNFSVAFALCNELSYIRANANTYSGSATGTRYTANFNSVIFVNGAGANYFPGNAAGATASGAQYG